MSNSIVIILITLNFLSWILDFLSQFYILKKRARPAHTGWKKMTRIFTFPCSVVWTSRKRLTHVRPNVILHRTVHLIDILLLRSYKLSAEWVTSWSWLLSLSRGSKKTHVTIIFQGQLWWFISWWLRQNAKNEVKNFSAWISMLRMADDVWRWLSEKTGEIERGMEKVYHGIRAVMKVNCSYECVNECIAFILVYLKNCVGEE